MFLIVPEIGDTHPLLGDEPDAHGKMHPPFHTNGSEGEAGIHHVGVGRDRAVGAWVGAGGTGEARDLRWCGSVAWSRRFRLFPYPRANKSLKRLQGARPLPHTAPRIQSFS